MTVIEAMVDEFEKIAAAGQQIAALAAKGNRYAMGRMAAKNTGRDIAQATASGLSGQTMEGLKLQGGAIKAQAQNHLRAPVTGSISGGAKAQRNMQSLAQPVPRADRAAMQQRQQGLAAKASAKGRGRMQPDRQTMQQNSPAAKQTAAKRNPGDAAAVQAKMTSPVNMPQGAAAAGQATAAMRPPSAFSKTVNYAKQNWKPMAAGAAVAGGAGMMMGRSQQQGV